MSASHSQIIIPENCGNSPKGKFLIDLNLACIKSNSEFITKSSSPEFALILNGVTYKDSLSLLVQQRFDDLLSLEIICVITHGKERVLSGRLHFAQKKFSFCSIAEFIRAAKRAIWSIKFIGGK